MKAIRFAFKSFFAGFFGCLGIIAILAIVILVIGLVLGESLVSGLSGLVGSLTGLLPGGNLPAVQPAQPYAGPIPEMEVFLTKGENPDDERITSFSVRESEQVFFWVRAEEGTDLRFELILTSPSQEEIQFGPTFNTDPNGRPVNCGQIQNPPPGDYHLRVVPEGSSTTVATVSFTITE